MPEEIQAKGMRHIENLKKVVRELHKDYGYAPGVFIDCVEAAMMEHRKICVAHMRKNVAENIDSGNPS